MKCGYSKKNINPPIGINIAGSYEFRYSKAIIDDLHARAVAFVDGEASAIIVSVDLCHMRTEDQDMCRERISQRTGVPADAIAILSTHTHAGPHVNVAPPSIEEADPKLVELVEEYVAFLRNRIIESACEAFENAFPAKLYSASGKVENVSNIRRCLMKDGTTVTTPGANNPEVEAPIGEPNTTVKLLKIVREGAKNLYMVNFGMHATTVHGGIYLSADYPGVVCSTLEKALDVECMFVQGAEGDACQINVRPSKELLELRERDDENRSRDKLVAVYSGQSIAAEVLKMHLLAKEVKSDGVAFKRCSVTVPSNKTGGSYEDALKIQELYRQGRHHELPYKEMALVTVVANANRVIRMKDEPDSYVYPVSVFAIGEFAFVCLPGEPFTEIRNRIDSVSAFGENTIVCALANCRSQYFPTTKAFSEGGYEVATTSIGPGADDAIVSAVEDALKELKQ